MSISKIEISQVNKNLKDLNEKLKKANSLKYIFFSSVLRGLGTAIGATLVLAILLAVLKSLAEALGWFPVLERILEEGVR